LEKIDPVFRDAINKTVLLSDSAGPAACKRVTKRFWHTESIEWVAQYCFDMQEDARRFAGPVRVSH